MTLVAGVAMVQLSDVKETKSAANAADQSKFLGFSAALTACMLSGFAGVYFEKILKSLCTSLILVLISLIPFFD